MFLKSSLAINIYSFFKCFCSIHISLKIVKKFGHFLVSMKQDFCKQTLKVIILMTFSKVFWGHYNILGLLIVNEKLMIPFWFLINVIQIYIITIDEIWHTPYAIFLENSINLSELDQSIWSEQRYKYIMRRHNIWEN